MIVARAARSASIFVPVEEKLPEAALALRDGTRVAELARRLVANSTAMQHISESERTKQYTEYHIPTFEYLNTLLQRHRSKDPIRPMFVGVSAPQVLKLLFRERATSEQQNCHIIFLRFMLGLRENHSHKRDVRSVSFGRQALHRDVA